MSLFTECFIIHTQGSIDILNQYTRFSKFSEILIYCALPLYVDRDASSAHSNQFNLLFQIAGKTLIYRKLLRTVCITPTTLLISGV